MSETQQIYTLIPKVMDDVGAVGKNNTADMGRAGKYKFRGIDDVYNAVQPALIKHNVTIAPVAMDIVHRDEREKMYDGKPTGTVLIHAIVRVTYRFFAPDASYLECVAIGEAMDSGDKCINKAMSAAMKYALFQTLCIPTEESKDTENDSHEVAAKPNAYAQTFVDLLSKALDSRGPGIDQKATLDAATARLREKGFTLETVKPDVGGPFINAVRRGQFDVSLAGAKANGEPAHV